MLISYLMRLEKILGLGIVLNLVIAPIAGARVLDGVDLSETLRLGKETLVLNGVGTRKATLFRIKVYVAGLYLTAKNTEAQDILNSDEDKKVVLRFVHDVPTQKMQKAWTESFETNCKKNCMKMKKDLEKLNLQMIDLKSGDLLALNFRKNRLEVEVKDSAPVAIGDKEFQRVILSTWLGDNPPNVDLKKGLLGLTENDLKKTE